jgi:hypothetical protein
MALAGLDTFAREALEKTAAPALPLRAYTGTYANEYVGAIEVVEQDGGLVLWMGSPQHSLPLSHFDRDIFTQVAFPEPPAPPAGVHFAIGPDGTARAVALDIFNDPISGTGQGTLTRVPPTR